MKIIRLTDEVIEGFEQDRRDLLEAQRLARENIEDHALQFAIVNRISGGIAALSSILEQCAEQSRPS